MRARPIILSKTCPYCGARSKAEAQMPSPANAPAAEFNLDDIGALAQRQSLSHLLALVELLPYKTFACVKCGSEFRMESRTTKELAASMLSSMQPVLPKTRTRTAKPAPAAAPAGTPAAGKDWESESLDSLFDYSLDKKTPG